jgi:hypothetical protein
MDEHRHTRKIHCDTTNKSSYSRDRSKTAGGTANHQTLHNHHQACIATAIKEK